MFKRLGASRHWPSVPARCSKSHGLAGHGFTSHGIKATIFKRTHFILFAIQMKTIVSLLVALSLVGCSGTMNGMIRGSSQLVQVQYEQGALTDSLTLQMPDGEIFKGKAVPVGRNVTNTNSFGSATAYSSRGGVASGFGTGFGTSTSSSGQFHALLFGNKGNSMKCQLQYADAKGLTTAGGVGFCEASNGKVIDLQW